MAAIWPSNQKDQGKVAVGVVAVLLAVVYFMYVYSPKAEELATTEAHVEQLRDANDKAKREMARGNASEMQRQAQTYARNLELMRQLVPTGNEVPALLEQVSTAARRVGLDLSTVEPQAVVVGEQFDTYRYKLSVYGSYHEIAEFLTNVGSLPRIVAPMGLSLSTTLDPAAAKKKKVASATRSLLDADFEIQTYVTKTAAADDSSRPRRSEEGGD